MNSFVGMMKHRVFIWTIILVLIYSLNLFIMKPVMAEEKDVQIITLEDALRITAMNNFDIQKAREYRNKVMAIYVTERAAALPQFKITASAVNSRDESQEALVLNIPSSLLSLLPPGTSGFTLPLWTNTRSAEIGLSQAIFTWGQVGAAIRAAKVGIATADDQLSIFRQAAFSDVSASFYDILLAKELYAIAQQNLEQKKHHYDEAQKRYTLGVVTDYDVLSGKVAVENAEPGVIQTENLIRLSKERLRFLLGTNAKDVDTQGILETTVVPYPEYEESVSIANRMRPEISDIRHRIKVAEELVKIANAGDKPRLDFKGSYGFRTLRVTGGSQETGPAWSAGLFLSFPIFDGLRTRGQVAQARSDLTTLKIQELQMLDSIRLEVRNAVNAVQEAGEIIKALSGTVTRAERLLAMAEKGYEYGVKTKLDVDDAELNLVQAKGSLARAKRDYLVACVNLKKAIGTLGGKEEESPNKK